MVQKPTEKRRHSRHKFAYPVKFDLSKPPLTALSFKGVLFNISIGGSCVQFEDRYGRVDINGLQGLSIKLAISIPESKPIYLGAMIHWIRRESPKGFNLLMGIAFKNIKDWQLEQIESFIHLKNKDQKMLWNLWENHVPQQ